MVIHRAILITLTLLALILDGWNTGVSAQSPCGQIVDGLPNGATITPLACVETMGADSPARGTWDFQVSRTQLAPGESIAPQMVWSGQQILIYVESGRLTLFDASDGSEDLYPAGSQALLTAADFGDSGFAVRNDDSVPLAFLRFTWSGPPPPGTATTVSVGEVDTYPRVGDSSPDTLIDMTVADDAMPVGSTLAFLARMRLEPGTGVADLRFGGPVAEAIESGAITVRQYSTNEPTQSSSGSPIDGEYQVMPQVMPVGQDVTVPEGQYMVVPTNTPHDAINAHSAPTSVLVVGLIPFEPVQVEQLAASVAAEFIGTWEGVGLQDNPPGEWPMVVELDGGTGPVVGTISYPTLNCHGQYFLEWADGGTIGVFEDITEGDACIDGDATFELQPGGSLKYRWTGERTTVDATLTRPSDTARSTSPSQAQEVSTGPALTLSFSAEDWEGGRYRGDGEWYGRSWVAVYGAQSPYPQATLNFVLDAVPVAGAALTLVGLDDELVANSAITVDVNGVAVYSGPSPFVNWDGQGQGENAAWTAVNFEIPADLLGAGSNEISVRNLEPSANYGAPPYILLSDAWLEG
jgi:hypothetical protein